MQRTCQAIQTRKAPPSAHQVEDPRAAWGAASIDADAMKISLIRPHLRTLTVRLLTAELVASGPPPQLG